MRCQVASCTRDAIRRDDGRVCAPHLAAARRQNNNADPQGPCASYKNCDCGSGDCCQCGWGKSHHYGEAALLAQRIEVKLQGAT